MNILVADISGKVPLYNESLCLSLGEQTEGKHRFFCATPSLQTNLETVRQIKLLNLLPEKYKKSKSRIKRIVKAIEGLLNYIYLLYIIKQNKIDILHLQWLPFLEFTGIELYILKLIRKIYPDVRIILTIHNVYPHNYPELKKNYYKERFIAISELIAFFIVHTKETASEVINEYCLDPNQIGVVHHGLFVPKGFISSKQMPQNTQIRFIMFGSQEPYKGTDLLVEAAVKLPKDSQERMFITIVGEIQKDYYLHLSKQTEGLNVKWIPRFVEEKELYSEIAHSDVIVLPYRTISQSGALMLALSFNKPIIASDLPSFKETLNGFSDDLFFETDNSDSLAALMKRYIDGTIDFNKTLSIIVDLRQQYSWHLAAQKTVLIYDSLIKTQ